MALREDLLAVGQPNNRSGRTHLWRRQPDDSWTFEQTLLIAEGVAQDHFGFSLALGSDQIFIGATGVDQGKTDAGALYVFRRVSNSWQRESKVTLENPRVNANFGVCVDHSDTGPYLCVGDLTGLHEFTPDGTNWLHVGRNGGGNLFSHWQDSATTYKDYLYGTTNSRPFNPIQRGRQIIARFSGAISLLEQGHHSIRATPLSLTNCYQRPLSYNPIGPDGSPPSDGDNDRIGDMQEIYMGTYADTNNVLSAGMIPVALPGSGLKVQWFRAYDTNLIVQAEPQWSADLSNWTTNGITVQNLGMAQNEEREILEAQLPLSANRMYFRLRFSLPPGVEDD